MRLNSFPFVASAALLLVAGSTLVAPASAQDVADDEPVTPQERAVKSKPAQAVNEQSAANLKRIGLILPQYLQDHNEQMPPMLSAQSLSEIEKAKGPNWKQEDAVNAQQALYPYLKDTSLFVHPGKNEIYQANLELSGRSTFDFIDRAPIVAFYEFSPAANGTRAVLYFDGRVIRERESDWPRILKTSDALTKSRDSDGKYAPDMSVLVPKVKTALGANRAMMGSQINVDGRLKTITLSGTVTSVAQRNLALKIASENAPGINLVLDLKQE